MKTSKVLKKIERDFAIKMRQYEESIASAANTVNENYMRGCMRGYFEAERDVYKYRKAAEVLER